MIEHSGKRNNTLGVDEIVNIVYSVRLTTLENDRMKHRIETNATMDRNVTIQTTTTLENVYTVAVLIECDDAETLIGVVECLDAAGFLN